MQRTIDSKSTLGQVEDVAIGKAIERAYDFTDQAVLITGGGTGIGKAAALLFAAQGADITIASRNEENLDQVAASIRDLGRRVHVVPADIRDPAACEATVASHLDVYGKCDVLVNNSGGSYDIPLEKLSLDHWERMINLNLRAVWILCLAAAPAMKAAGKGAIVNISSTAARDVVPEFAPYAVAKLAVEHLTELFAGEWGPSGIRVNCVRVGSVKSEGFLRAMEQAGRGPDELAIGHSALGRAGWPIEVGHAIVFLASQAASYINGSILPADGGVARKFIDRS